LGISQESKTPVNYYFNNNGLSIW